MNVEDRLTKLEAQYETLIEIIKHKSADKECLIHGCREKNTEGDFIGDICPICYDAIVNSINKDNLTYE